MIVSLRIILACIVVFSFSTCSSAEIVTNLLSDPGFEALTGNNPNSGSTPWFTSGEDQVGSVVPETTLVHSGAQSLVYQFYYDRAAVVQNVNATIDTTKIYESSVYSMIAEPSSNSNHVEDPIIAISIWTSPTFGGTYTYRAGKFNIVSDGTWKNQVAVFDASTGPLSSLAGEYIQVRYAKSNVNTTHRIFLDDAAFGIQAIPEPTSMMIFGIATAALFAPRRRR